MPSVLLVGMEAAGGMIVSQLASSDDATLTSWCDMVYMRKKRKNTGTLQQLEGPEIFTRRTPTSDSLPAIWIDDVMSTGSSMLEGIKTLKKDYNIDIVAGLFLVDRSVDRHQLEESMQHLNAKQFDNVKIFAIYDLNAIDQRVLAKSQ